MISVEELAREHPFMQGLPEEVSSLLAGCARNAVFRPDERLTRENEPASDFFLVRDGRVAVEIFVPRRGRVTIQTAEAGEVVGLSWMAGSPRWTFDSRATMATRTFAIDVACVYAKCEEDPAFGYALMKRFSHLLLGRLQATRLRLLDMYA
ncbi:MAG: cyclic nucleotide-binding domain-containing protein [Gammaproteobacteria bacterium]|nr:cyclic nucleotide-binding domain-containing protein [Gammaproteobacteria bacterium]TVQ48573.1 MAG: cyclic nucleotide-binding domain-containing protein [Gammaproteobacteria bacterium]